MSFRKAVPSGLFCGVLVSPCWLGGLQQLKTLLASFDTMREHHEDRKHVLVTNVYVVYMYMLAFVVFQNVAWELYTMNSHWFSQKRLLVSLSSHQLKWVPIGRLALPMFKTARQYEVRSFHEQYSPKQNKAYAYQFVTHRCKFHLHHAKSRYQSYQKMRQLGKGFQWFRGRCFHDGHKILLYVAGGFYSVACKALMPAK